MTVHPRIPVLFVALLVALAALAISPAAEVLANNVTNPASYLPKGNVYARVPARVNYYASPSAAEAGTPAGTYGGDNYWLSLTGETATAGGRDLVRGTWSWGASGWFAASSVQPGTAVLSTLQGVDMAQVPNAALVTTAILNVREGPGTSFPVAGQLRRYDTVSILETRPAADATWYRVGTNRWVSGDLVRRLQPSARPAGIAPGQRWIEINLATQTLYAHEGDRAVFGTLTSTGRPGFETVQGVFSIFSRSAAAPMAWETSSVPYSYSDVPYIQYFSGDYGIHATYWHDDLGNVRSAGCVNLSPADAQFIYEFSRNGTPVWVHGG